MNISLFDYNMSAAPDLYTSAVVAKDVCSALCAEAHIVGVTGDLMSAMSAVLIMMIVARLMREADEDSIIYLLSPYAQTAAIAMLAALILYIGWVY